MLSEVLSSQGDDPDAKILNAPCLFASILPCDSSIVIIEQYFDFLPKLMHKSKSTSGTGLKIQPLSG